MKAVYAIIVASFLTLLFGAPLAFSEGNSDRGQRVFGACAACHSLQPDQSMTGPSLAGLWNRKAGSLGSFSRYSPALQSANIVCRDGKGGLAPSTVRYMHVILKASMRQAVRWQILARNPVDAVDPPKIGRAAMTTYDLAQTANLIDATRGTRMMISVILAVLCGLRRGEIAALRWRNINLNAAQLAVTESAEQTGAGVRYKRPKSGKGAQSRCRRAW